MERASDAGVALADMLAAMALVALVSATALPVVATALDHERAIAGALYLSSRLRLAQLEALRRGASVAVRVQLRPDDTAIQLFVDGDGTGVLVRDIDAGIDPPIGPVDWLGAHAPGVALRINQAIPDIGGGGVLERGSDPLRIGRTTLVSFSPTGGATGGTLYVAAPRGPQLAVRITGTTGRLRVLRFLTGARVWRP